jgi:hypothetical protein
MPCLEDLYRLRIDTLTPWLFTVGQPDGYNRPDFGERFRYLHTRFYPEGIALVSLRGEDQSPTTQLIIDLLTLTVIHGQLPAGLTLPDPLE